MKQPPKPAKKDIHVLLEDELVERLKERARTEGRTLGNLASFLVARALRDDTAKTNE